MRDYQIPEYPPCVRCGHVCDTRRYFSRTLLMSYFLWRGKFIFNNFKHDVVGGQGKYRHHHALDARRYNKLVV